MHTHIFGYLCAMSRDRIGIESQQKPYAEIFDFIFRIYYKIFCGQRMMMINGSYSSAS